MNTAPAPVFSASAPPAVTSAESVGDALNVCRTTVINAAELLWEQDKTMAWAYHLQRAGAWLAVRAAPATPAPDSPRTGVPPPPPVVRRSVDDAFSRGQWAVVLNEGEPLASKYIYWLDLHRMVSVALGNLGPEYAAAKSVVGNQVRALADRLPALLKLAFSDGNPFASDDTQAWLASAVRFGGWRLGRERRGRSREGSRGGSRSHRGRRARGAERGACR